ncbi:hypothetical protein BDZ91DRAFT_355280 [Kalaharituber pfeilii]|nr:hypothetical protein BDZ91DRAFT_355280 [Kalaharituber pfeilii]
MSGIARVGPLLTEIGRCFFNTSIIIERIMSCVFILFLVLIIIVRCLFDSAYITSKGRWVIGNFGFLLSSFLFNLVIARRVAHE